MTLASNAQVTPVSRPVVVEHARTPETAPGVTKNDLPILQARLARGDRAGVYVDLYNLTGDDIWLMHAQITSYSGLFGGAALSANFLAKLANPRKYNVALDVFSREILESMLRVVKRDVESGGTGRPSVDTLRTDGDRGVWKSKGMGDHFPGNILFMEVHEHGLSGLGTFLSKGTLHGLEAGLDGAKNGKRPSEFRTGPYRTHESRDRRFITVTDNRTQKMEVFFDKEASGGLGVVGQIDDEPLSREEYRWHERTALWEFLQANQDSEQTMDRRVLFEGGKGSLPNPNIPGLFEDQEILDRMMFRSPTDGNWYNEDLNGRVRDGRLLGFLEARREEALDFRRKRGLSLEPQIPGRYTSAKLWPARQTR
ncbi:MAG: hypothetical protein ACRBN8_08170 [Nannocystales bacterium]